MHCHVHNNGMVSDNIRCNAWIDFSSDIGEIINSRIGRRAVIYVIIKNEIYKEKGERKMKLSKKKLKYFIKDEKKASKEYRKYGLNNLAKDEYKHRKFLPKK